MLSPSLMDSLGHSGSQTAQLMHSSLISNAMVFLLLRCFPPALCNMGRMSEKFYDLDQGLVSYVRGGPRRVSHFFHSCPPLRCRDWLSAGETSGRKVSQTFRPKRTIEAITVAAPRIVRAKATWLPATDQSA